MQCFNLRPISCYIASLKSVITGELDLNETLSKCDPSHDVCYGKMTLRLTNSTTNGSIVTTANIAVEKGCGHWTDFNTTGSYSYIMDRQCFVTGVKNTTMDTGEGSGQVEEVSVITQEQTEVCLCEGSRCNGGCGRGGKAVLVMVLLVIVGFKDFWRQTNC